MTNTSCFHLYEVSKVIELKKQKVDYEEQGSE